MAAIFKNVRVHADAHHAVRCAAAAWDVNIQAVWCALAFSVAKLEKEDLFPEVKDKLGEDENCKTQQV